MSVSAGTVQLVITVLSLGEMLLSDHVILDITVHRGHQAQGRFLVTQEHTVKGKIKNPHCVLLEHSSPTTLEQA